MPTLIRDFETRSTQDLHRVGAHRYATDPTTQILCVGYAVDAGPVEIWTPGQPVPEVFVEAANTSDWLVVAHNDAFESAIEAHVLNPRHGWPIIPMAQHRCTMAMALAAAMPAALENAAVALALPFQKDRDGSRLMRRLARDTGEEPDAKDLQRLYAYCHRDVEVERALFQRLPLLSQAEQALWELDALINRRGFHVDRALAQAARKLTGDEQRVIDQAIASLTDGDITSANQVARIRAFVERRGHPLKSLSKYIVAQVLAHNPEADVKRLLELRRDGSRAAARKLDSLLAGLDPDDRLRGTFRFHGAATGRWSGSRFQPQNLKKPETADLDQAIEAILAGDVERVRAIGAPLAVAGDISRAMICAAPGQVLIGADFSAIESRVLAWLADEVWKVAAYRRFDTSQDPTFEPYCVTASRILKRPITPENERERGIGKTCDLAFGYGGGLGAWRRFDASDTYSDTAVEQFKSEWRAAHRATVKFWYGLESGLRRALVSREHVTLGPLAFDYDGATLWLTLPNGRRLAYPEGRFEANVGITFKDNARGGWNDVRGWHGIFVENVVAGISRDLLAAAMQRLEGANYAITLHVHDELVAEVPEGFGSAEEFVQLMTMLPDWANGLPIAAKAWTGQRYAKTKTPMTSPVDSTMAPKVAPTTAASSPLQVPKVSLPNVGETVVNGKLRCPFHDDSTPSLQIYPDHFHCFGCGAHGDWIDWLMMVEGMDRDTAVKTLEHWHGPVARSAGDDDGRTLANALRLWEAAQPIADTPAIRYLADIRGIDTDLIPDAALRFHPACPFGPGMRVPCLIALYRDCDTDEPAGIHRIALTPETLSGGKVHRMTLGRWPAPRAIKFWPATDQLFLGEGIETVLAAAMQLEYQGAPMRPAWAAGHANGITNFPVLRRIQRLILLVDHDEAGETSTGICRARWLSARRDVMRLRPRRLGADFNDIAIEKRFAAEAAQK